MPILNQSVYRKKANYYLWKFKNYNWVIEIWIENWKLSKNYKNIKAFLYLLEEQALSE